MSAYLEQRTEKEKKNSISKFSFVTLPKIICLLTMAAGFSFVVSTAFFSTRKPAIFKGRSRMKMVDSSMFLRKLSQTFSNEVVKVIPSDAASEKSINSAKTVNEKFTVSLLGGIKSILRKIFRLRDGQEVTFSNIKNNVLLSFIDYFSGTGQYSDRPSFVRICTDFTNLFFKFLYNCFVPKRQIITTEMMEIIESHTNIFSRGEVIEESEIYFHALSMIMSIPFIALAVPIGASLFAFSRSTYYAVTTIYKAIVSAGWDMFSKTGSIVSSSITDALSKVFGSLSWATSKIVNMQIVQNIPFEKMIFGDNNLFITAISAPAITISIILTAIRAAIVSTSTWKVTKNSVSYFINKLSFSAIGRNIITSRKSSFELLEIMNKFLTETSKNSLIQPLNGKNYYNALYNFYCKLDSNLKNSTNVSRFLATFSDVNKGTISSSPGTRMVAEQLSSLTGNGWRVRYVASGGSIIRTLLSYFIPYGNILLFWQVRIKEWLANIKLSSKATIQKEAGNRFLQFCRKYFFKLFYTTTIGPYKVISFVVDVFKNPFIAVSHSTTPFIVRFRIALLIVAIYLSYGLNVKAEPSLENVV